MTAANEGRPLQVTTDPGTERCEGRPFCGLRSRWRAEALDRAPAPRTMGELAGATPRPPIRFVCENHLLGALVELLELPLLEQPTMIPAHPSTALQIAAVRHLDERRSR